MRTFTISGTLRALALGILIIVGSTAVAQINVVNASVDATAARHSHHADRAMMLAAANAGTRIVAVGANGYVILSDDGGVNYRQARQVPVNFTLTSVSFSDAHNGWAVGHAGTVIHTNDGGENWTLQRLDMKVDQPLYSVYFRDPQTGWAAGLWSLLIHTTDGGKTWEKVRLPVAEGQKRADLNLLKIFGGVDQAMYIAAEQGTLFRSGDNGEHWQVTKTGSNASLWAGTVTAAKTLIVGGLGGKLLRSTDNGDTWQALESHTTGSITDLKMFGDSIAATSLEGDVLQSGDDGKNWRVVSTARLPLTGMVGANDTKLLVYSKEGPIALLPKN